VLAIELKMTENASEILDRGEIALISDLEERPTGEIMRLSLFRCENRACEMEFPVFQEQSNSIVYCPRCKGMIIKKTVPVIRVARVSE